MQQKESGESVVADEPKFLIQPLEGLSPPGPIGVAIPQCMAADTRQCHVGGLPGVAGHEVGEPVPEVAREVKLQPLGQHHRVAYCLGVVGQSQCHVVGRAQYRLPVAAAHGLRCIEGEAMAHGHQGVLQECATGMVGMYVTCGHHGCAHVVCQRLERPCKGSVPPCGRTLDLHPRIAWAEGRHEPSQCVFGIRMAPGREQVGYEPVPGTARQAHEPICMCLERVNGQYRVNRPSIGPGPRVCVRPRDEAAQVGVPRGGLDQQGEVEHVGCMIDPDGGEGAYRQLGTRDGAESRGGGRMGELHRPRQGVVIGDGQSAVAQRRRGLRHLIRQ